MAKWTRLEGTTPVFQRSKGRPRPFMLGEFPGEWFWVMRYVSPTVAWAKRMSQSDAIIYMLRDTSTPFMSMIRPPKSHE